MGAIAAVAPGGEIVSSLKSGAIGGSEFAGRWLDMAIGLHRAVGFYYDYPDGTSGQGRENGRQDNPSLLPRSTRLYYALDASSLELGTVVFSHFFPPIA